MQNYDVIVIGAGAAGMLAAGTASESGAKVLLLEKMKMAGRKLRITGKGRCNLTNVATMTDFLKQVGKNARFLRPAFSNFFSEDLIEFFKQLGVQTITERGGRVFPESEDAVQIAEALTNWLKKSGVKVLYETPVEKLVVENGEIKGVSTKQSDYYAKSVIVATGGVSYPATGSTGDGYKFAKAFGHSIIPIRPALVPLETKGDIAERLMGVSLKNVNVSVWFDGKKQGEEFGEMLFTHFGLSGPVILTLSRQFIADIQQNKKLTISIDLKPALDDNKLDARLLRDLNEHGKQKIQTFLRGLLPSKMLPICSELVQISEEKLCNQVTAEERKRLRIWLKNFKFEISGHRSFNEAIITSGGVEVGEVNPKTMESKLVKNLYFAGEVLDLDANTGGYNLQIAFSTGRLAGISAYQSTINDK